MKSAIILGLILSFAEAVLSAEARLAWPRFRGPDGGGVAEHDQPPVTFGPDQNLKWKVAVPGGLSSPIVAGDKLVMTAFDDGKLVTMAYHRDSGKEAWRAVAPAKQIETFHKVEGSPAASTPATDGERIVSYFGSCGLFCYDLTGKELWKYELPTAKLPGDFGTGVSPILADGLVVLVRDEPSDGRILALDVKTGRPQWETKRLSPVSYATPIVLETPAGKQIAAAGHARITGYDLRTGAEKWFVSGAPSGTCASPVAANGLVYFAGTTSGGSEDPQNAMPKFDDLLKQLDADKDGALAREEAEKAFAGFFDNQDINKDGKLTREEWDILMKFFDEGKDVALAVKPDGTGDVTTSQVLWKQTKALPYLASAIFYRGQYLMVKDGGVVTALDPASGKELYRVRIANGKYYASPVAANGHLYCTSLDGTVTVLKWDADRATVAVENPKLDERTAATPAIADDTIYIRTEKHLYAFAGSR
jgi:outer membrane protein assembly factor BamB